MEKFKFNVSARGKTGYTQDFESGNVFRDVAQKISEIDLSKFPNGCTVKVFDKSGNSEEFWVINKKDGTQFVRYGNRYNFEEYIDWDLEPKYLTCLDEETNEYKYYLMNFNKNTEECEVQYGRIGHNAGEFKYEPGKARKDGTFTYPAQMFWIKYYEKIAKGYIDHTEDKDFERKSVKTDKEEYLPIAEDEVRRIMEKLIKRQKDYVYQKFDMNVPSSRIAIEKADRILSKMERVADNDIDVFVKRDELISLYRELVVTLPRKIENVSDYIRRFNFNKSSKNYIANILTEERELLQNFTDVYDREHEEVIDEHKPTIDVLSANNLSSTLPTYKEQWSAEDKLCNESYLVSRVLNITNNATTDAYNNCKKKLGIEDRDCHLLFHGSRTENWWSIFKNGMSLNPNAVITGKMFGHGLYFAPLAKKTLGYTNFKGSYWSCGSEKFGYLALFEVAMGKSYEPTHALGSSFTVKNLRDGCHSVWAYPSKTSLYNEECIVFREEQCNIKYLIEMDSDRKPFERFNQQLIRNVTCSKPVYHKKTDTITVKSDLGKWIYHKGRRVYYELTYDCKADTLNVPELSLNNQECKYLCDVYKSNFADSPVEFREWLTEFKEHSKEKNIERIS